MRLGTLLERALTPALLLWLLALMFHFRDTLSRGFDDWFLTTKAPSVAPVTTKATEALPPWILPARPRFGPAPKWCLQLMRHPRERQRVSGIYDCGRGRFDAVCNDTRPRFFGQYNQDLFTWRNHWRYLRRRGLYVDIAANEPVRISNSYFFDACLGWHGVCVEANPRYFDILRRHRRCALVQRCVGDEISNVTFIDEGGLSGIEATNKNSLLWRKNGVLDQRRRIEVNCVRTRDALGPLGVSRIDFLSLDVEGHELEVLQGLDWETTRISVLVVENVNQELYAFMREKGYRVLPSARTRHGKVAGGELWSDLVFVHSSVTWGRPV